MFIGAPGTAGAAAYEYELLGGAWTQTGAIPPLEPPAGVFFASQLALDPQFPRVAIGSVTAQGAGKVYLYEKSAGSWQLTANLAPPGLFGFVGPLQLDGDTLIVGNSSFDRVLVMRQQSPGNWVLAQTLLATGFNSSSAFGANVVLSGNMLAVSSSEEEAPAPSGPDQPVGRVYVYTRPSAGSNFTLHTLVSPAFFSVFVTDFGERIALTPEWLAIASNRSGQSYVDLYPRNGASISGAITRLTPAVPVPVKSLALSGTRLLVGGAPNSQLYVDDAGAPVPGWNHAATLSVPGATTNFGSSTALDASAAYIGDQGWNGFTGEVFEFGPPAGLRSYCSAKLNSQFCLPQLDWSGLPSASGATSFDILGLNIVPQRGGILIYGFQDAATPFIGGLLCVSAPRRTAVTNSGGSAPCSGVLSRDFGAHIQSGVDPALIPGAEVFAQWWFRDPAANPLHGLSDAVRMLIQP